jgi:hypothetical protein
LSQYSWPRDGNKKGFQASKYHEKWPIFGNKPGVQISRLATAIKKPDSEPDIWRPYFWLTNSNEYGLFEAKYLASIFLARRQQ